MSLRWIKAAVWMAGVALAWPQVTNAYDGWSELIGEYNHSVTAYNDRMAAQDELYGGLLADLNGGGEMSEAEVAVLQAEIDRHDADIAAAVNSVTGRG